VKKIFRVFSKGGGGGGGGAGGGRGEPGGGIFSFFFFSFPPNRMAGFFWDSIKYSRGFFFTGGGEQSVVRRGGPPRGLKRGAGGRVFGANPTRPPRGKGGGGQKEFFPGREGGQGAPSFVSILNFLFLNSKNPPKGGGWAFFRVLLQAKAARGGGRVALICGPCGGFGVVLAAQRGGPVSVPAFFPPRKRGAPMARGADFWAPDEGGPPGGRGWRSPPFVFWGGGGGSFCGPAVGGPRLGGPSRGEAHPPNFFGPGGRAGANFSPGGSGFCCQVGAAGGGWGVRPGAFGGGDNKGFPPLFCEVKFFSE